MHALGCAAVINVEEPITGRSGSVLIWSVHWLSETGGELDDSLASADSALRNALRQEETFNARNPRALGLVLMSQRDPRLALRETRRGSVHGLCFWSAGRTI